MGCERTALCAFLMIGNWRDIGAESRRLSPSNHKLKGQDLLPTVMDALDKNIDALMKEVHAIS